jgi:hypothetical protein
MLGVRLPGRNGHGKESVELPSMRWTRGCSMDDARAFRVSIQGTEGREGNEVEKRNSDRSIGYCVSSFPSLPSVQVLSRHSSTGFVGLWLAICGFLSGAAPSACTWSTRSDAGRSLARAQRPRQRERGTTEHALDTRLSCFGLGPIDRRGIATTFTQFTLKTGLFFRNAARSSITVCAKMS